MHPFKFSAFLVIAVSIFFAYQGVIAHSTSPPSVSIHSPSGENHHFIVEIARTPEQQARGLMGRKTLKENSGMLFINQTPKRMTMWMKDTLLPLDMLFIDERNKIHHIHHSATPHSLEHIHSNGIVSAVLEINGGLARKLHLQKGDVVKYALQ